MRKKNIGQWGEDLAERFLKEKGYKILGRNLTTHLGEIDIVATKGDRLHFVEVRVRQTQLFGSALESISFKKLNKVRKAATVFINKNAGWERYTPCISLVTIDGFGVNKKIEFLEDVWLD